jgi:drug/metabolite transporter (DMT)-like permease
VPIPGSAFAFALLAGVAMAAYSIFTRLGSAGIHPALGAVVITGVAFLVNLALVGVLHLRGVSLAGSTTSVALLAVVGAAAAAADLFTLSAYASGLRVTSSFVIGGTSAVLVLLVGFLLLREPFSVVKLLAIGLIVAGVCLLQREGL